MKDLFLNYPEIIIYILIILGAVILIYRIFKRGSLFRADAPGKKTGHSTPLTVSMERELQGIFGYLNILFAGYWISLALLYLTLVVINILVYYSVFSVYADNLIFLSYVLKSISIIPLIFLFTFIAFLATGKKHIARAAAFIFVVIGFFYIIHLPSATSENIFNYWIILPSFIGACAMFFMSQLERSKIIKYRVIMSSLAFMLYPAALYIGGQGAIYGEFSIFSSLVLISVVAGYLGYFPPKAVRQNS